MTKDEALMLAIKTIREIVREDKETNIPRCVALREVIKQLMDVYVG